MNKKISVIIPVHNAIKEFRKCLRSIIKYFDFDSGEVIVIDDASDTEFSVPSCIKFMRNEKNEGYLKATTVYPGETITGNINVEYEKGAEAFFNISINSVSYPFSWTY